MTNAALFTGELDDNDETVVNETDINPDDLIGEGKRWRDSKSLIKGKLEADETIKRRERENEALRKELFAMAGIKEKLDQLLTTPPKASDLPSSSAFTPPASEQQNSPSATQNAGLTKEDVEKLLAQRENAVRQEQNQRLVRQKLTEQFGKDYVKVVQQKAEEIGESIEYFEELAKTRPNILLHMIGSAQQTPQSAPKAPAPTLFSPSVNTTPQGLVAPTERTQKFYDQIKKSDPKAYWSPKVQNEMHKDAIRLGSAFFD